MCFIYCMCTWHMHMNNEICALMWKSQEVEHLPLFLSFSPHHSLEAWSNVNPQFPFSAGLCDQRVLGIHPFLPPNAKMTELHLPSLLFFIFMCLCAVHLCVHVWWHVHAWEHMCGGTHVDGRLRSMLTNLPSVTFPPYWKGKNLSIKHKHGWSQ